MVLLPVDLLFALYGLIEPELLQSSARNQQARGIGCGIVRMADWDPVLRELRGGGMCDDLVTDDGCICDLTNALLVCEAHDETILAVVVLVLVLAYHLPAGLEIGLAFATTALLNLVALVEGFVLDDLDECHGADGR